MAILQKTREKAGLAISIIIALALLSFIIDPQTLDTALNAMSSKNDVGNIDGKKVTYTDFQQELDKYTVINEMVTGSTTQTEEQQEQLRNAAWQGLVDKYLFVKNASAAGIRVGEEEMRELLAGDMVSPVIAQNPAFMDENGNFSPEAVRNLTEGISQDQTGRLAQYWNYVQNTVYTQQFYTKYGSLFNGSNIQNPLMLRRAVAENNNSTNVDFVMVPVSYAQDTTIQVTDAEIKKYYEDHKDMFRQNESRDMEYVVFEVKPSEADIEAANASMNEVYDEFATTDNMKSFLARNSERSSSEYWYKAGELSTVNRDVNDFVFANEEGTSPVYPGNSNKFYAARIMATAQVPDSVYVRHILLQGVNADAQADSILNVLSKGGNFANLVASHSADTGSSADGELGNIGWMTQNYMIPGFESVLTSKTGRPFILKTQYGTHVVEVTRATEPVEKKQVAILEKTAIASGETFNSYYADATKFAGLCKGKYENYKAAVDSMGVYSHPLNNVAESNSNYGSIGHAKEVTRWIFDNKPGKVSEIITVDNNYLFIATVKAIHEEGIATLKETSSVIRQRLYADKASEKLAADVAAKIEGLTDLQAIAEKLGSTVSSNVEVRFASMAGQGLDPKFIGAASVAPEGQICGPVAGSIGAYVFKVNSRDTGAFYTEDDARNAHTQYDSYMDQMIVPIMMTEAEVKDNRARFF